MTLLVGIRCTDGIVLASDGAATLVDAAGRPTARQPTDKLQTIAGASVLSLSGNVGVAQELRLDLDEFIRDWNKPNRKKKPSLNAEIVSFRDELMKIFSTRVGNARRGAAEAKGYRPGDRVPLHELPSCGGFVATVLVGQLHLYQLDDAGIEEVDDQIPGVSKGSGAGTADPFLAMIRRVAWGGNPPKIEQAQYAAYWTLRHVIDTNTGGVADPIQIWSMILDNGKPVIHKHPEDDLQRFDQVIQEVEAAIKQQFSEPNIAEEDVPEPPASLELAALAPPVQKRAATLPEK